MEATCAHFGGEETWVLDLQDQSWTHWREEDCADLRALLANKARVQSATQDYLHV